ncbi:MAG: HAD-IC family P-type ATPase, partial [Clostridia bacterium]|nr:HAD-IC family P-type ATPase [Clostridia bacterium]
MDYAVISEDELLKETKSSIMGLGEKEVNEKIKKYGRNVLPKPKKKNVFKMFLEEFKNPIDYILFVTLVLSVIVGEYVDAGFIFFIIILDALLGTIQEFKAIKDMESLLSLIKVEVKVRRNNKEKIISSEDLVIGDIVLVESGSKISADLRVLNSYNLTVDESLLTGESIPVIKSNEIDNKEHFKSNILYAGTSVMSGRATCIVIKTASNTEVGKITQSIINEDSGKAPLVEKIEKFTKQISIYAVIIAIILLIVLYFKDYDGITILLSVIALSISAIPEGLPLAMTMALTVASRRMAKRNVIAKKLNSVETLGSVTVIASDKTGTLTLNEQTAKKIILPNGNIHDITGIGYNGEGKVENIDDDIFDLVCMGALNNESTLTFDSKWNYSGDSIDIAFKALGYKADISLKNYKLLW